MTALSDTVPLPRTAPLGKAIAWVAMPATALVMLASLATVLWTARAWPLVNDASIMHYVVFLMDHGFAPYRDVPDLNMPGAHLSEAMVMHILGSDAQAWRLWDMIEDLLAIAACVWIVGAGLRWAGVAAGAFGCLVHLSDGPMNLGQRDWLVAVLLLGALGSLMSALRSRHPAWMGLASMLCGLAATIKPHVLLVGLAFFAAACWLSRPKTFDERAPMRGGPMAVVAWSFVGMMPPTAMVLAYLTYWQAWPAFLDTLHGLVPWYVGLQRVPLADILDRSMWAYIAFAGYLTISWPDRRERGFDLELVFLGVLGGLALFLIQGKGWAYHRYTEMVFLALWAALASARVASRGTIGRLGSAAGLALCAIFGINLAGQAMSATYAANNLPVLERDLQRLGGPALSGKVQCLDMVMGSCITALYDLKLVSATGILGDPGLFPDYPSPVVAPYQKQFAEVLAKHPPEVIVISAYSWPAQTYDYEKLHNWPAFSATLASRYRLAHDVPNVPGGVGYRLYVLKGAGGGTS